MMAQPSEDLFQLVKDGDLEGFKRCCQGVTVNIERKDKDGWALLHWACRERHIKIVQYLVECQNADVASQNNYGLTPLHLASRHGYFDIVMYLVEQGASIEAQDNAQRSPLQLAFENNHTGVWEYLNVQLTERQEKKDLQQKLLDASKYGNLGAVKECCKQPNIDVECHDGSKRRPLHWASLNGHLDIVRYLVEEQRATIDSKDDQGSTPLQCATQKPHTEVTIYLAEKQKFRPQDLLDAAGRGDLDAVKKCCQKENADIECRNDHGWTPLHIACRNGHMEMIRYLVEEQNASIDCREEDGWTPLHMACRYKHMKVIRYLVDDRNADVGCQTNNEYTPLHWACRFGHERVVRYLVEHNADIDCQDEQGQKPLHLACRFGRIDIVRYLVNDKKMSVESPTKHGTTALHWACCFDGHTDVVQFLVEDHGANTKFRNRHGLMPIHHACRFNGNTDIIRYLIEERGVSPEVATLAGKRPLHWACYNGYRDVVQYLVDEQGVKIEVQDDFGCTPSRYASQKGHTGIVEYLEEHKTLQQQQQSVQLDLLDAIERGDLAGVKDCCKEFGADPKAHDQFGSTPLHWACYHGHVQIARYLISKGAGIKCRTTNDSTPLQWACSNDNENIVKCFVDEFLINPQDQHIRVILTQIPPESRVAEYLKSKLESTRSSSANSIYTDAIVDGEQKHVGELKAPGVDDPTMVWSVEIAGPPYFFLSHRGPDTKEEIARPTHWFLKYALKVETFFDDDDEDDSMPKGGNQMTLLTAAAHRCTHAVVILSKTFRESEYCVMELNTFMARERSKNLIVLPTLWKISSTEGYTQKLGSLCWITSKHRNRSKEETAPEFMISALWPTLVKQAKKSRKEWDKNRLVQCLIDYVEIHRESVPPSLIEFATQNQASRSRPKRRIFNLPARAP